MALFTEIIGYTAAVVGTSLMFPQVYKSYKTKKVDDLSWGMVVLYFFNCLLWLVYGFLIKAWPLVVCNFIALIISIFQVIFKLKYTSK